MNAEYDHFAKDFSDTRTRTWPEIDEFLIPSLKKGDKILDLGCGNGRLRGCLDTTLIPNGNYYGFDISAEMLAIAHGKHPQEHFFKGDMAKKLPFGNEVFDGVAGIASFHHLLSQEDQLLCLRECHRVLKPGGILFLTTWMLPSKYRIPNMMKGRFKNWVIPFGSEKHPRTYRNVKPSEIKKLFQEVNINIGTCCYYKKRNLVVVGTKEIISSGRQFLS